MSRIRGSIADSGLTPLINMGTYLRIHPIDANTYQEIVIPTVPTYIPLSGTTAAFNFTVVGSDKTRPAVRYRIEIGWLDEFDGWSPADFPGWDLWIPDGDWTFSELLGLPANPWQVWVGNEPPDSPTNGVWWYNPTTYILSEWSGNVATGYWVAKANLRGGKGEKGDRGVQGLAGTMAETEDAAVADWIGTEGDSKSQKAVDGRVVAGFPSLADAFANKSDFIRMDKLWATKTFKSIGHSYLSAANGTYGNDIANRYGVPASSYSTLATSAFRPQDIAASLVGSHKTYQVGGHGVILYDGLLNALIEEDTLANRSAAWQGLRAVLALLGAGARIEQDQFTFSANFGDQQANPKTYSSGGSRAITTINGATATIPIANAVRHYLLSSSFAVGGLRGGTWSFTQGGVAIGDSAAGPVDTNDRTVAGTYAVEEAPLAIDLGVRSVGQVVATYGTASRPNPTYGVLDVLLPQMATPPLIFIMKPIETTINTHNKPSLRTYLRTLPDLARAEFGAHVHPVDAQPGWNKDTMLEDQLHPNALGKAQLVRAFENEVYSLTAGELLLNAFGTTP